MASSRTNWANVLTWSRLVLIVPITVAALLGQRAAVVVLFLIAGVTDFLDGRIARASGTTGPRGAAFDSNVDFAFLTATMFWLWLLFPLFFQKYLLWAIIIMGLQVGAQLLVRARLKVTSGLHLWSGKLSAGLLFVLLPVVTLWGDVPWFISVCIISGLLSELEAIAYVLKGGKNLDARFFWDP